MCQRITSADQKGKIRVFGVHKLKGNEDAVIMHTIFETIHACNGSSHPLLPFSSSFFYRSSSPRCPLFFTSRTSLLSRPARNHPYDTHPFSTKILRFLPRENVPPVFLKIQGFLRFLQFIRIAKLVSIKNSCFYENWQSSFSIPRLIFLKIQRFLKFLQFIRIVKLVSIKNSTKIDKVSSLFLD